jgi:UDP-glucose 4-epimerase
MDQIYSVFKGKRILITGGLGFIGSNLARKLVNCGANVLIVDSLTPDYGGNLFNINDIIKRIKINISDIRDEHSMRNLVKEKDYLFNLAGQTSHLDSMKNPFVDLEINCFAQLVLLEACRKYNSDLKLVFTSTRQIYGKPDYLPVDEKHSLHPVDVNGINKMAGEKYHILYNDVYGIRTCALRLTNTYGPGMRIKDARQTFLGLWIRLLNEGKILEVYGDGSQVRDFNYVDDVVDAILLAGHNDVANGNVYNLGSKEKINLGNLASLLIKINGSGDYRFVPFPPNRKSIDIGDYYSNYGKIALDLGWNPKISLESGLEKTLEYYERNFANYI